MIGGISFIGVDESTDFTELEKLANLTNGPEIEFGILYSESKMMEKHKRYPSKEFIQSFLKWYWSSPEVRDFGISIHLCGSAIDKYLAGDDYLVNLVGKFDRVQLNFSMNKYNEDELINKLMNIRDRVDTVTVLQFNKSKKSFCEKFMRELPEKFRAEYDILFDGSGGFERVLTDPERPFDGFYCGYAGGIGPDTVKDILVAIDKVNVEDDYYYIDMESAIRTDNLLSIDKCKKVIEIVNAHLG